MYDSTNKVQYFAFISHKSADSKFALKMQKFIESYNLPTEIRATANSPKRLTPICSYEVDFSANPLYDEMEAKLRQSHYLILICSENITKQGSKYINFEIETFIKCKQEEGINPLTRIIPIIASGEFASGEHDCRPDALKELGDNCPIAINRQKCKNDREVFLHAISAMLDIDYAVMENRDKKRQRNKKIVAASLACVGIALSAFLCEYFIPQKQHYVDFAMKNGIPVGIESLSRNEYSKIDKHYIITKKQHKIVSLEYVNTCLNPENHSSGTMPESRPSKYVFEYSGSSLSSVTYYDKNSNPYFIMQYSGGTVDAVDFKDATNPNNAYYIGLGYESDSEKLLSGYNLTSHSDISRFEYQYNSDGYVTKLTFHANNSGLVANDNAIYGFEYERDALGRITAVYYLDAKGERRLNSEGIYCKKYSYSNNNLALMENLSESGNLIPDADGIFRIEFTYDKNHNKTAINFTDENGAAVVVGSYGGASQTYTRDNNGRLLVTRFFDEKGNPSAIADYCAARFTYDKNGYQESRTYLDANDNIILDTNYNYATLKYENDDKGNALTTTFLDEKGNLINNKFGYATEKSQYNNQGLETRVAYYDNNGNPADYQGFGYSVKTTEYDEYGRETAISYFDGDNNPVNTLGPIYSFGYHQEKTIYNYGANTKITGEFYDADGNLTNSQTSSMGESYAKTVIFVQDGIITSQTSYDKNGDIWGDIYEAEIGFTSKAEKIYTIRTLDKNENLIRENVTIYTIEGIEARKVITDYDNGKKYEVTQFIYRDNGTKLSADSTIYDADEKIIQEYKAEYNDADKINASTLICHTDPASYQTYTEYTYDANNNILNECSIIYDENMNANTAINNNYDISGNKTDMTYAYYTDGVMTTSITHLYNPDGSYSSTYVSYDKDGNQVYSNTSLYAADGELISGP